MVNLSKQYTHWSRGSVRMEMISEFAMSVRRGDHFLSMDIEKGYRHFRLHPRMRDWFLFHYSGRYFRCVALPFGWGRSPLWFTQLLSTFVRKLRAMGLRFMAYLDDFLIAPSDYGTTATKEDCLSSALIIGNLLEDLGLRRHKDKGNWDGSQVIEHLGVVVDSCNMRFTVVKWKA